LSVAITLFISLAEVEHSTRAFSRSSWEFYKIIL